MVMLQTCWKCCTWTLSTWLCTSALLSCLASLTTATWRLRPLKTGWTVIGQLMWRSTGALRSLRRLYDECLLTSLHLAAVSTSLTCTPSNKTVRSDRHALLNAKHCPRVAPVAFRGQQLRLQYSINLRRLTSFVRQIFGWRWSRSCVDLAAERYIVITKILEAK